MQNTALQTKTKRRWWTVFALSAAAFVDSSENDTISILWPSMYRSLGCASGSSARCWASAS